MDYLSSLLAWINKITQAVIVLIPLAIVLNILFGKEIVFVGNVVENLIGILNRFASQGFIGLIALAIIIWIFALVYKSDSSEDTQERQVPPTGTGGV